jgi:hypothetical protein
MLLLIENLTFTPLSPCISMNQIKIKRPTNALRNVQIAQTAPHHNPTQRKNTQSTKASSSVRVVFILRLIILIKF